jgi:prepilin-type N-terminal cleavage/methylation domain-containing protein
MKNLHKKSNRGFTLIELLVVISIISLLASVVLAALNSARSKARDAKRMSDLHQIQLALELYYNANGSYPSSFCESVFIASQPGWNTCWLNGLGNTVSPAYIASLPNDPINSITTYNWYSYLSNTTPNGCAIPVSAPGSYMVTALLENPKAGPNSCVTPFSNQSDNPAVNYYVTNN